MDNGGFEWERKEEEEVENDDSDCVYISTPDVAIRVNRSGPVCPLC